MDDLVEERLKVDLESLFHEKADMESGKMWKGYNTNVDKDIAACWHMLCYNTVISKIPARKKKFKKLAKSLGVKVKLDTKRYK